MTYLTPCICLEWYLYIGIPYRLLHIDVTVDIVNARQTYGDASWVINQNGLLVSIHSAKLSLCCRLAEMRDRSGGYGTEGHCHRW